MSYTIVGTAYVHKYLLDEELKKFFGREFDVEVINIYASCSTPSNPETDQDFEITVAGYDWSDVPNEEGYYAVQYAATVHWHKDYWGEVDADADIHWSNVEKLTDKEVQELLRYEGLLNNEQPIELKKESFESLFEEVSPT